METQRKNRVEKKAESSVDKSVQDQGKEEKLRAKQRRNKVRVDNRDQRVDIREDKWQRTQI